MKRSVEDAPAVGGRKRRYTWKRLCDFEAALEPRDVESPIASCDEIRWSCKLRLVYQAALEGLKLSSGARAKMVNWVLRSSDAGIRKAYQLGYVLGGFAVLQTRRLNVWIRSGTSSMLR